MATHLRELDLLAKQNTNSTNPTVTQHSYILNMSMHSFTHYAFLHEMSLILKHKEEARHIDLGLL